MMIIIYKLNNEYICINELHNVEGQTSQTYAKGEIFALQEIHMKKWFTWYCTHAELHPLP